MSSKRFPDRAATRGRILRGAEDFVTREGLQRLTMDRLATHMGMSKKTIYTCFRSKTELVQALIANVIGGVESLLQAVSAQTDLSCSRKMRLTRDVIIERVGRLGLQMLEDLALVYPEIWREVDWRRAKILTRHFDAVLNAGVDSGEIRSDVNVGITSMLMVRAISRIGNPRELINQPYSIEDLISGLLSMLFTGVLSAQAVEEFVAGREKSE